MTARKLLTKKAIKSLPNAVLRALIEDLKEEHYRRIREDDKKYWNKKEERDAPRSPALGNRKSTLGTMPRKCRAEKKEETHRPQTR